MSSLYHKFITTTYNQKTIYYINESTAIIYNTKDHALCVAGPSGNIMRCHGSVTDLGVIIEANNMFVLHVIQVSLRYTIAMIIMFMRL